MASLPEVARLYKLSERFHIQYKITLRVREGDFSRARQEMVFKCLFRDCEKYLLGKVSTYIMKKFL